MSWPEKTAPTLDASEKRTLGEGVFKKCDGCGATLTSGELAAVFDRGEEVQTVYSVPPAPGPPEFLMSATLLLICSRYSSSMGIGQTGSPQSLAAATILSMRGWLLPKAPLQTSPRATVQAPVSVATSMMAFGPSLRA